MVEAHVLALPNFQEPFVIETVACITGIGAVLLQGAKPIAYFSQAQCPRNQALSTYEKELLAIMSAVGKWSRYLVGAPFVIRTDHLSLKYLQEQKIVNSLQQKWLYKLLGYNFTIEYKPGKANVIADALSRQFDNEVVVETSEEEHLCALITHIQPSWVEEVISSYEQDKYIQDLIAQAILDQNGEIYTYIGGILRYKGRVMVGRSHDIRMKIMSTIHSSAIRGHSGIHTSYLRGKSIFYWFGMKRDFTEFILACDICKQCKDESLLPWSSSTIGGTNCTLDSSVTGLPKSEGKDVIWVIVDRLTKYAHFIALSHPYTAEKLANIYIKQIYKLHGAPKSIVSDRDVAFQSDFWRELFKLQGTKLCMSTAHHPRSDGQTERINRCLETYLRCMVHTHPRKWNQWLSLAEWWYNTCYHHSTKFSPFRALYGYDAQQLSRGPYLHTASSNAQALIQERTQILQSLKEHMTRAQERMKL